MKVVDKGEEGPRVLTVIDPSQRAQEKEERQREGVIFRSGLQSKIKLEFFNSRFAIDGISLYDEGRNSLISSSMFNQIKTLLQLERTSVIEDTDYIEQPD